MTRQEFLETLRRKLNGRLSAAEVEDNIRYYDGYISREMTKGRSETEVLSDLGEPDLIGPFYSGCKRSRRKRTGLYGNGKQGRGFCGRRVRPHCLEGEPDIRLEICGRVDSHCRGCAGHCGSGICVGGEVGSTGDYCTGCVGLYPGSFWQRKAEIERKNRYCGSSVKMTLRCLFASWIPKHMFDMAKLPEKFEKGKRKNRKSFSRISGLSDVRKTGLEPTRYCYNIVNAI